MAIQKPARAGSPHNFQELVSEYLVRHRSVLDVMSKFQEATARVNRALVKSVTACGCLQVNAQRQTIPLDISLHELKKHMDNILPAHHVNSVVKCLKPSWATTFST